MNNAKDYELDTNNYYLKLQLSNNDDTLTKTLTIALTDTDETPSKLTQTSFSVGEDTRIISNLDNYLSKDILDEITYKILSDFDGDLFANK